MSGREGDDTFEVSLHFNNFQEVISERGAHGGAVKALMRARTTARSSGSPPFVEALIQRASRAGSAGWFTRMTWYSPVGIPLPKST